MAAAADRRYCVAVVTLTLLLIAALVSIIVLAQRLRTMADRPSPPLTATSTTPSPPPTAAPPMSPICRAPYYGKEVGHLGPPSRLAHGVSGVVYVVDAHRIRVRDLTYDGTAPEAFFWIGLKGKAGEDIGPFGEATPDEHGSLTRLPRGYSRADVILTLQHNVSVTDLRWFALWCVQYQMNFGHVTFPPVLDVPRPQVIGQFSNPGRSVRSGPITALDDKTLVVEKFSFDPRATDVYFYAGNGSGPAVSERLVIIPRVDGGSSPFQPNTLRDVNMTLTFPDDVTLHDVDFVSVYSRSGLNYATVMLPRLLYVPPYVQPSAPPTAPPTAQPTPA